jgi:cellobiose dehydrogenase (acceptor)
MDFYTRKVFARIPSDDTTSMDGKRFFQQGYEVIAGGLRAANWINITANNLPDTKNKAYSYTPFMFSGGERGGPLATYLWSATRRPNMQLWTGTQVRRLIRTGSRVTGVEVEPFINGGYVGRALVKPTTGRVILSAGVYGTAKILFRSELYLIEVIEHC